MLVQERRQMWYMQAVLLGLCAFSTVLHYRNLLPEKVFIAPHGKLPDLFPPSRKAIIPAGSAEDQKLPETSKEIKALTHMYRDTKIVCDLPVTTHLPKLALW